jgi:hypothetical protein
MSKEPNNRDKDNQTSATNLFMNSFSQKAGYVQGNQSRTRIRLQNANKNVGRILS